MELIDYQQKARSTAIYPAEYSILYPLLGLSGEVGEICEKVKKRIRDKNANFEDEEFLADVHKEIGDVLWYVANLSHDLGFNLNDIAEENLNKLLSRKDRGKLQGSGDNR